jgi:hypothetical protein
MRRCPGSTERSVALCPLGRRASPLAARASEALEAFAQRVAARAPAEPVPAASGAAARLDRQHRAQACRAGYGRWKARAWRSHAAGSKQRGPSERGGGGVRHVQHACSGRRAHALPAVVAGEGAVAAAPAEPARPVAAAVVGAVVSPLVTRHATPPAGAQASGGRAAHAGRQAAPVPAAVELARWHVTRSAFPSGGAQAAAHVADAVAVAARRTAHHARAPASETRAVTLLLRGVGQAATRTGTWIGR